jgi:hypothetical protein
MKFHFLLLISLFHTAERTDQNQISEEEKHESKIDNHSAGESIVMKPKPENLFQRALEELLDSEFHDHRVQKGSGEMLLAGDGKNVCVRLRVRWICVLYLCVIFVRVCVFVCVCCGCVCVCVCLPVFLFVL